MAVAQGVDTAWRSSLQVHLSSVVSEVDSALFQPPGTVRVVEGNPEVTCGAGTALSIDPRNWPAQIRFRAGNWFVVECWSME